MANWSDTSICFYGDEAKMKEVEKEIRTYVDENFLCGRRPEGCDKYDENDYGFNCMKVSLLENYGVNIMLAGMGRCHGPFLWFKCIVEKYGISGEYHDRERGAGFYNRIIAENGEITEDKTYDYISKEALEHVGYETMLYDMEWAAETYDKDPQGNRGYLQEFADVTGCTLADIFEDLNIEIPKDIKEESNNANGS
jgi:hypothetical protein